MQGEKCNSELRQHLQQLRQENKQLKSQINAARGNLKALGIPASQVRGSMCDWRASLELLEATAKGCPAAGLEPLRKAA